MVFIFCLSYLFHGYIVVTKIQPNTITKILLILGGFSLVALIKAEGLWYWGLEIKLPRNEIKDRERKEEKC